MEAQGGSQLGGMVHCGICGRRMAGQWNRQKPVYRCRFTKDYPGADGEHPKSLYVDEDAIVPGLDAWIAGLFDDDHIDETCEILAGASDVDPEDEAREAAIREGLAECDAKLAKYRELLDLKLPGSGGGSNP